MQITINGTPKEIAALVAAIQEPRDELFIRRMPSPNYAQVTPNDSADHKTTLSVDKLADSILGAINMSIEHPRQKSIHDNTEA